jgi:heat-inducible transcriptional repressor
MHKLDTRKAELLAFVVREHSRSAQPVASEVVKEKAGLDLSPATIRNEMAELEKEGFLRQPHTSAGRVPTEAGYRYYVTNCLETQNVEQDVAAMRNVFGEHHEDEARLKMLARQLARTIEEGVFVGFAPQSTYYTGLAYLFDQPEFESVDLVRQVGEIIDNLDRVVAELFDEIAPGVQVYVGSENPFGEHCGTVLLRTGSAQPMMGVLGPIRMDYDRTIAMMKALQNIL